MTTVTQIAKLLADDPVIAALVENRVMDMDYRVTQWENAINYRDEPIDIMDDYDYIRPCIVVDDRGLDRQYIQRRGNTFMEQVAIWVFVPVGRSGNTTLIQLRNRIMSLTHLSSLPNRKVMMVDKIDGSLPGTNALFDRIELRITHLAEDHKHA